jgi:hypothetical protein
MSTLRFYTRISLTLLIGYCTVASAFAQESTGTARSTTLYGSAYTTTPLLSPKPTGLYAKRRFLTGQTTSDRLSGLLQSQQRDGELTAKTKQLLYKAFAKMTCIEFNELGANYYTAERNYHPVSLAQTVGLPGFQGGYVQLFTDGKRYVAIDPRSLDTWVTSTGSDVTSKSSWKKLLHIKDM